MANDRQRGMAEATRLTRSGQLAEATAVIQRALAGDGPAGSGAPGPTFVRSTRGARSTPAAGSPGAAGPPRAAGPAGGTGVAFLDCRYAGAAGERRYKLFVPSGRTGAALPLVVMLHGGTQGPDDFAAGTGMNALAERQKFLVAYPEQSTAANQMKYWNWFLPAHQRRGAGEPALIAGLTAEIVREHGIDPDRVYVAGFSAGAAMAAVVAATYPDVYAAAGVHSGLAYASAQDTGSAFAAMKNGPIAAARLPGRAIPLIVFHGDRDSTVDASNADRLVAQWRPTGPAPSRQQGRPRAGRAYTQLTYPAAAGTPEVEQWTVHGSGHAWSGGGSQGSYTDPAGPDASAEMARFFARHARGSVD